MEAGSSLPLSQVPATYYPEPVRSSPYFNPNSWRSILILSSHVCLGLPSGLFPSGIPTKTLFMLDVLLEISTHTWITHLYINYVASFDSMHLMNTRNRKVLSKVLTPVTVPPSIVDRDTSTDMVVRETANVTLMCKATGYPEPYVMWRREDGEDIFYNGENGEYCHLSTILKERVIPHRINVNNMLITTICPPHWNE